MNNTQNIRYALMCLTALESENGKHLSSRDIATRQGVPLNQCRDALRRLAQAGLIQQGDSETFVLRRPLESLNALDVVAACSATEKPAPSFALLYGARRGASRWAKKIVRIGKHVAVGAFLLGLLLSGSPVHAAYNVGTKFADVIMENVTQGKVYNLRTMRNLPYRVHNDSDGEVDLMVSIEIPDAAQMKPGYEPIPDPSWVRVVPSRFKLAKGEQGIVDVILQVPTDEAYKNHHYQAHIICKTADPEPGETTGLAFGVNLQSRLRFSVASPGPEEIKRMQKRGVYQMLNFTLEPDSQYVPGFLEPGKTHAMKDQSVRFSLINRSPQALDFNLKAITPPDGMTAPAGYEIGDPSWVKLKTTKFKAAPESIKGLDFDLAIPDKPELRGKRFMFVVQAGLEGRDIPVEVYGRVYANIAK